MATIIGTGGGATNCPFPIGYGGFFQIDPNTLYKSTTWEQKKNVFILAAGETYPAGSTGGEAEHMLAEKELPYVAGHITFVSGGLTQGIISTTESSDAGVFSYSGKCSGEFVPNNRDGSTDSARRIDFNLGANEPHNNMPPYFAMPFWIRTA